jgi:hypothetical protein
MRNTSMVNEATRLLTSIFNEGSKGFSAKCLSCLGNPRRKRREYDCEQEGVVATCVCVVRRRGRILPSSARTIFLHKPKLY